MADKLTMFGKSFNTLGDHKANLCLCTSGDVKIKTAGKFVTIFKNGKLNVDDTSEIFTVDSGDAMKKTGIYLVNGTSDSGDSTQSVYLYVDGTKILLASDSEGFVSYTAVQELTADQFIQGLSNIGLYFQTLDDAKALSLQQGLVYILEDQKLYKIVNGEYTEFTGSTTSGNNDSSDDSSESEETTTLQIGTILIDGESSIINGDDELYLQVGGDSYILLKSDKLYFKKDIVLDKSRTVSTENSVQGESGFMLYCQDDEAYLEVDNLIVHNSSLEYEPQLFSTYIGTAVKNQIRSASWKTAPTDISLILKYQNNFVVGDYIVVNIARSNQVAVEAKSADADEETGEEAYQFIQALLETAASQDTVLKVTYSYPIDEDTDGTGETTITIPATTIDGDTGETVANTYGESTHITGISTIDEILSVEITSGDSDIYYGSNGGGQLPSAMVGTVAAVNPMVINLPNQTVTSNSIIQNLANSPIYKIGSTSEVVNILYHSADSISLQECTVSSNTLVRKTTTKIGDLSSVQKPQAIGSTEPAENFSGRGVYSENLVAVMPTFYGGTFEGTEGTDYPVYGESLTIPTEALDDEKYDKVIPCIAWVKKLIEQATT